MVVFILFICANVSSFDIGVYLIVISAIKEIKENLNEINECTEREPNENQLDRLRFFVKLHSNAKEFSKNLNNFPNLILIMNEIQILINLHCKMLSIFHPY